METITDKTVSTAAKEETAAVQGNENHSGDSA